MPRLTPEVNHQDLCGGRRDGSVVEGSLLPRLIPEVNHWDLRDGSRDGSMSESPRCFRRGPKVGL